MKIKELGKGRSRFTKPSCPACNSKQTLFRRTSQTHWCRVCGCEFHLGGKVVIQGSIVKKEEV